MRCAGAVEDGGWFCLAGVCFALSGAVCVRVACCAVLLTLTLIWRDSGLLRVGCISTSLFPQYLLLDSSEGTRHSGPVWSDLENCYGGKT